MLFRAWGAAARRWLTPVLLLLALILLAVPEGLSRSPSLAFSPAHPVAAQGACGPLPTGAVVRLAGTPHLFVCGADGRMHWGGDTRALAQQVEAGAPIVWESLTERSLQALGELPLGDPWLSSGLLKWGDPIGLVKWESGAEPLVLHIQCIADVERFGLDGANYGRYVYDPEAWAQASGRPAPPPPWTALSSATGCGTQTPTPTPSPTRTPVPSNGGGSGGGGGSSGGGGSNPTPTPTPAPPPTSTPAPGTPVAGETATGTPSPTLTPTSTATPSDTATPSASPSVTSTPGNIPPPVAGADSYAAIGNVRIQPAAPGVLANDTDTSGTGLTVTAFGPSTGLETAPGVAGTSAQGGILTVNANGSFSYDPPPGFTGSDTFRYRVSNGAGGSAIGTVTVTVSGMIWFVDNARATNGDGRLSAPYNCLAGPFCFTTQAPDEAGDNIFLFTGSSGYVGGMTLLNNQRLLGQGASAPLATITGLTVPAGSDPLPSTGGASPAIVSPTGNTITLGQNNTIRGLNLGNRFAFSSAIAGTGFGTLTVADASITGNGQALDLTTGTLAVTLTQLSSDGAANNVELTGVAGTLTATTGTLSGASARAVDISGSTASITLGSNIANSNTGISVTNQTAGTVTFSGASKTLSTGASPAVTLSNNTGGTVAFTTGGLAITTSTGAGFAATGGGTATVSGAGNTITSGLGVALEVTNTTIGAAGLTFQGISAGTGAAGPASGIILNNTGSSGGLTVTGATPPVTCTLTIPTCSGGTIQNTTGAGIFLTITRNVSLSHMLIQDTGSHGIEGGVVVDFTLQSSVVDGAGNADNEDGIRFAFTGVNNLSGTAAIRDSFVRGAQENGLYIRNDSGTLALTVDNTDFSNSVLEDGILLETFGTATMTVLVEDGAFSGLESDGIKANANAGTLNITARNNLFTGDASSDNALSFVSGGSATMRYTISGNTLNASNNSAMILQANDTSAMHGRVLDNEIIGTTNGRGIDAALAADNDSRARLLIQDNSVSGQRQGAMFFNANNTAQLDVTVLGNTLSTRPTDATAFENLTVSANGTSNVCTNIRNNSVAQGGADAFGPGMPADAFRLDDDDTPTNSTLRLERGDSSPPPPIPRR